MERNSFSRVAALSCLLVVVLAGCAGMNVKEDSVQGTTNIVRPSAIYIRTFDPGTSWEGDFGGKSRDSFIQQEMQSLDQRLIAQLQDIAPTSPVGGSLPANGLLVTGQLQRVNAGSGVARYFMGGFGVGAREVTGRVQIFDLAKSTTTPILAFNIEGGSRGEGGIIGAVDNLNADWDRIGRETKALLLKRIQP